MAVLSYSTVKVWYTMSVKVWSPENPSSTLSTILLITSSGSLASGFRHSKGQFQPGQTSVLALEGAIPARADVGIAARERDRDHLEHLEEKVAGCIGGIRIGRIRTVVSRADVVHEHILRRGREQRQNEQHERCGDASSEAATLASRSRNARSRVPTKSSS